MNTTQWILLAIGAVGWYGGIACKENGWGHETLPRILIIVGVVSFFAMIAAFAVDPPNKGSKLNDDCFTDWDGRSNPTNCN